MSETITIKIPLKGVASGKAKMTAHAEGIKGASCVEETKKLIDAPIASESKTPEYYQHRDEVVVGRVG